MNPEIFKTTLDSIAKKLGEEQAAIIADDLGTLKTAQKQALDEQANLNKQIEDLTTTNKQLVASNAGLLQKIPAVEENTIVPNNTQKETEPKHRDPYEAFDKFGRLKK